jgi:serine/threonine protein kinase
MNQERILKEEDFKKRYRYDAQSPYKSGKQGVIYRAHDFQQSMQVRAIKKAQVDPAANKERYSVMAEYQRVKRFENNPHPNVLRYYHCERFPTEMGYYDHCVMEFIINGQTLKDIPLNQRILLAHPLLKGVLEGLQHIHTHGLIHRDLKPDNILVEHYNNLWVPKLADFGISIDVNEVHLREDFMVGTPPYMALEQLESRTDHRLRTNCDLWAFGVLVYWYFTNQTPWVWGSNITELEARNQIIEQIKAGGYLEKLKVIPQPFQQIAQRCMIADPHQRARSANELLALIGSVSHYSEEMETVITYDPKPEVIVPPDQKPVIPNPPVPPPPVPTPFDRKKKNTEKKTINISPMLLVVFGAIASAALVVYLLFLSQQIKVEPFPTKICTVDNFDDCITEKISNIVAPIVQQKEKGVVLNISWKVSKEGTVDIDIDKSANLDDSSVDQIKKIFNDLGWQPATSKLGLNIEHSMSPLELTFAYNPSN